MVRLQIERWSFWSPESPDPAGWSDYWADDDAIRKTGEPDPSVIPAMQRRRLSRLSKMALAAALDASSDMAIDYSIFCSQHGEIVKTSALLSSISQGVELSPTAFAQSVHNTSSGLFTVISKTHTASSSIASGPNTFAYGWIEAQAYLHRNPNHRVLLVDFDEVIPDEYQSYSDRVMTDYALALVLRAPDEGGMDMTSAPPGDDEPLPQGPLFLAWERSTSASFSLTTDGRGWQWDR